jgi:hypothetical protein
MYEYQAPNDIETVEPTPEEEALPPTGKFN